MTRYNLYWAIKGYKLALENGWGLSLPEGAVWTCLALECFFKVQEQWPNLAVPIAYAKESSPAKVKQSVEVRRFLCARLLCL